MKIVDTNNNLNFPDSIILLLFGFNVSLYNNRFQKEHSFCFFAKQKRDPFCRRQKKVFFFRKKVHRLRSKRRNGASFSKKMNVPKKWSSYSIIKMRLFIQCQLRFLIPAFLLRKKEGFFQKNECLDNSCQKFTNHQHF